MTSKYARSDTLSASAPQLSLTATLTVRADNLPSAVLTGGAGDDMLQLVDGGTFDLTLPTIFTGIETIRGSDQHDTIILDQERFTGVTTFDGGDRPETHWDELVLRGDVFDFSAKTLIGVDRLSLQTDNSVLIAPDLKTAMLASGLVSQNDRLEATSVTFTAAQLKALHKQGIDTIVDAAGMHVNTAPLMEALNGDRIETSVNQTVFIDAGRNAIISDDDGTYALLSVAAPRGLDAPGRLGIDTSGTVTLDGGYAAGSLVMVGGIEVGMLWEAGDASLSIAFNNVNAISARVQELIRAVTFTTAGTPPETSTQQPVTVTLTDEGGRRSAATVTIVQDVKIEPPHLDLSHASVPELARGGTLVGLLTAKVFGAGDTFTYKLVDDAGDRFVIDGDKLLVANGAKLDYEQQTSHKIVVRATAKDESFVDESFTIAVEDVKDEVLYAERRGDGTGSVIGSDGNDTLIGSRGRDKLSGGLGNDKIFGRLGNDVLIGGKGKDALVFDTKPHARMNVDRIMDFNVKDDAIYLDNKIFKALGSKGTLAKPAKLNPKMFWKGTSAHDADDRVIYNPKTGALYYDADGTGASAAVKIAVLLPKKLKTISYHDFFVI
ncbi:hypothetical protein [Microvirga sp. 2TAF3]|uniref:hypothetical protein n=1 Tax=Microvirga sp. 2TAF3 TaxID=3233014 RepID=UPI003F992F96